MRIPHLDSARWRTWSDRAAPARVSNVCHRAVQALCLAVLIALAGCATHFENFALAPGQTNQERRSLDLSDPDRPLILVALSGGGSRAAALGWTVLRDLRTFEYSNQGKRRALVDDIQIVSSVSGGSVTAAYFGLYGPGGLDGLGPAFLDRDNMATLGWDAVNPITWIDLAITGASRIDVIEELFDQKTLFNRQTFAALNQPGKPFIIFNTTDMASGEIFSFTPERFDDICSDFDKQPISAGVAASAAVPIATSPVAFRNYSASGCRDNNWPAWIADTLNDPQAPYVNLAEYKRARYANDLRRGAQRFRDIEYLYFLDGGLADNLGIHALLAAVSSPHATGSLTFGINTGIRKLAVIVINARADPPDTVYQSASRPGIIGMINSVITIPIDSASASVNAQMEVLLEQIKQAARAASANAEFKGMRVYGIEIDFDQLRVYDKRQFELQQKAKSVPTSWTITRADREVIEEAGHLLLRQHPCFQKLLLDLEIKRDFLNPEYARTGCPER